MRVRLWILLCLFPLPMAAEEGVGPRMLTKPQETPVQLWTNRCRMCHASPSMLKTLGVADPSAVSPWRVAAEDPARFKTIVTGGYKRMPSFYALTDAQVTGLQTYLVSTSTPGSPVPPR